MKTKKKNHGEPCHTCGEDTQLTTLWNEDMTEIIGHKAQCINEWCYEPYSNTTYLKDLLESEYVPGDIKDSLKRMFEMTSKRLAKGGKRTQ